MKHIGLLALLLAASLFSGCRQYDEYTGLFRYQPEFNIDYLNYLVPDQPTPVNLHDMAQ